MTPLTLKRKKHRLGSDEYTGQGWFFVTMCCKGRKPVFSEQSKADWIIAVLKTEADAQQFLVDAYCVMPDHLHFLVLGILPESDLLAFTKSFKQKTAYSHHQKHGSTLWQKNFYDHVLRSHEKPAHVAAYIWMNPVRKGLCKNFEDYPYSGSFTRKWKGSPQSDSWVPPWKSAMPA